MQAPPPPPPPLGLSPEDERIAQSLVEMHAGSIPLCKETSPCAYLLFLNEDRSVSPRPTFVRCDVDRLQTVFETQMARSVRSVHWLMEKVVRHDPTRERVVGVVFPNREVLTNVVMMRRGGPRRGG